MMLRIFVQNFLTTMVVIILWMVLIGMNVMPILLCGFFSWWWLLLYIPIISFDAALLMLAKEVG